LVERLLCKQDVSGSSPLTSICESRENEKRKDNSAPVKDRMLKSKNFR
jgi:hypothetical protein